MIDIKKLEKQAKLMEEESKANKELHLHEEERIRSIIKFTKYFMRAFRENHNYE